MTATPHRRQRLPMAKAEQDAGRVICDRCGYWVDLIKCDWRCWHCGAQWPRPDADMVVKWRNYLREVG